MLQVLDYLGSVAKIDGVPFSADEWRSEETPAGIPRTPDGRSAGVFVCAFADKLARQSGLIGQKMDPTLMRRTIAKILRRGRFDSEDFSLLEGSSGVQSRFQGPARPTAQTVVLEVAGPSGMTRETVQEDPLLEELDVAIGKLCVGGDLFSQPKRAQPIPMPGTLRSLAVSITTATPERHEPMITAVEDRGEATAADNRDARDEDGNVDELVLTCSDIDEEPEPDAEAEPAPSTPSATRCGRPDPAVPSSSRHGRATCSSSRPAPPSSRMRVTISSPSGSAPRAEEWVRVVNVSGPRNRRPRPHPHPNVYRTPARATRPAVRQPRRQGSARWSRPVMRASERRFDYLPPQLRQRVGRPSRPGRPSTVRARDLQPEDLPWVPRALVRRLRDATRRLSPAERRNKRWRIFLSSGSFVRVRPSQVEWLISHR